VAIDPSATEEVILKGTPGAPGVAHGPCLVLTQNDFEVTRFIVAEKDRPDELARFDEAVLTTRQQIIQLRREVAENLGETEAQIFDAHLLVLEDQALIEGTITEQERTGYNIEYCFSKVAQRYVDFFDSVEDEYLRERTTDIRDVTRRVLRNLMGHGDFSSGKLSSGDGSRIVVSSIINASDVASFKPESLLGFVSSLGGRTSHAVIMARSMEIPAVVGVKEAHASIRNGDDMLIDGYDGVVIIRPSEETLFRYGKIAEKRRKIGELYRARVNLPADTRDGVHVVIRANIEGSQDVDAVIRGNAEGVGLFRTESVFLRDRGFSSEEHQFEEYRTVVEALKPHPVTIRTLDVGGDKALAGPGLGHKEENAFMGFRGIRLCLRNPELFKTQLRAILRASAFGKAKVLYPMISGVRELIEANALLEEAKKELKERKLDFDEEIEVGCMIEVPSAACITDILAPHCDFFSVGTNDLIQYLLAVDRVNDRVAHLYEPSHPAVIRTLRMILESAHEHRKPVSICGEMAGDPIYVSLLLGLGADDLSMTPTLMPEIKYLVRHFEIERARSLAQELLAGSRPGENCKRLEAFYHETIQGLNELENNGKNGGR